METALLVTTLRNEADAWSKANGGAGDISSIMIQAADKIERLRAALKGCADDLEASVNAEYRGTLDYPSQRRKYDRDMGPVIRARHLLG